MHALLTRLSLAQSTPLSETLRVALGAVVLFACTQVSIPLNPVPITLQTLGVLLIGLTYSPKEALKTLLLYVGCGLLGLPVFTNFGTGIGKLLGPTGGYLIGFILAAPTMAWLLSQIKTRSGWTLLLACAIGQTLIYAFGLIWLSTFLGVQGALQHGLLPFILPGAVKAVGLSAILGYVKQKAR